MSIPTQSPKARATRALSLIELLVVLATITVVAALLLPPLLGAKAKRAPINCIARLKQIGLAFNVWAADNGGLFPMQVPVTNGGTMELVASGVVYPHFQVMSNELSTPKILLCPQDTKRNYSTNFARDLTDRNLSYFLNTDATKGDGSTLLSGDRNVTNRASAGTRLVSITTTDSIAWTTEMHRKKGHIVFGDGRADSFSNKSVGSALKIHHGATNRLAVP